MGSIRVQLALILLSSIAECCLAQEFNSRLQSFPNGAGSTKPSLRAALQRLTHYKPLPHPDVLANNWEASESSESFEWGPGASDSTTYSLRSALLPNSVDSREPNEAQESTVQDRMKESEAHNITEELGESETAQQSSTPASGHEATQSHEAAARTASLGDTNVPDEAPVGKIGEVAKVRSGPESISGVEENAPNLRNPGQYVGNTLGSQRNYYGHLMPYNQYFPGYPHWPNLVYPQFAPGCSRALGPAGFGGHPSDPSQIYYPHAYPYSAHPLGYPYLNGRTGLE